MILDAFLFLIGALIRMISLPMSAISSLIPQDFQNAIGTLISYLDYGQGFFPVETLITAMGTFMVFLIAWYSFKLILWLFGLLPLIGKVVGAPGTETTTISRSQDSKGFKKIGITKSKSKRKWF